MSSYINKQFSFDFKSLIVIPSFKSFNYSVLTVYTPTNRQLILSKKEVIL